MQQPIYITKIFLLTLTQVGAQSFGLPGTTWEHCWTPMLELPPTTYIVQTISGPTFERDGMDCNALYFSSEYDTKIGDSISICRSGDQVFYLEGDSMYLLYDFSRLAGDTLVVRYPHGFDPRFSSSRPGDDDDLLIAIDSVTTENMMGVALRRQHIRLISENPFVSIGSSILERVGFENWVLPHFGYIGIDGDGFIGLRSYMDADLLLENEFPCDITLSTKGVYDQLAVNIYPNPARDLLVVEGREWIKGVTIYDLTGKKVALESPSFGDVWMFQLDDLVPGIYFAEVRLAERVEIRKVAINR